MKPKHHERGTVIVEFALLSTLVMMMIFGIIELGRAVFTYHLVSNAARLGTRYAIVHGTSCYQTLPSCAGASAGDIQTYVRSVSPGVDANSLSVTTTWGTAPMCQGGSGGGCLVTVTATYSFTSVVPLLNLATIPMTSSSTMVISQ